MSREVRRSRRGFLGTLAAGTAVGLLAACGSPAIPAARQATTTTAAAASTKLAVGSTPVPSALIAGSKASVTIEVWDWANNWEPLLQHLAHEFVAQEPTYKIHLQIPPDYNTKLLVAFAGGTAPDAYRIQGIYGANMAYRGTLLDLSSYLARDKAAKADFDGMAKASQQAATYNDKVIGMPFGGTLIITIYNEDLLKGSALTPPAVLGTGWDWNKVVQYGEKLTQRGSGPRPSVYGFWANEDWQVGWLPFVRANGGDFLDPAKHYRECILDQPPAVDAMQFLVDLVLKNKVSPTAADLSSENGTSLFLTGKIAMTTVGSWQIPQTRQAKINFDIAAVPYSPSTGKTGSDSNFSTVGVNPKSRVTDAAVHYALWNGTAQAQKTIGAAEFMPASIAAADATYFQPNLGPAHRSVLREILKITTPQPAPDVVSFDDVINVVQQELPVIFSGSETVQAGLIKVTKQINAKIQAALKTG